MRDNAFVDCLVQPGAVDVTWGAPILCDNTLSNA